VIDGFGSGAEDGKFEIMVLVAEPSGCNVKSTVTPGVEDGKIMYAAE
jgi:hypothetical protein